MKKLILALVILLTSFSFNSCNKEENEIGNENKTVVNGVPGECGVTDLFERYPIEIPTNAAVYGGGNTTNQDIQQSASVIVGFDGEVLPELTPDQGLNILSHLDCDNDNGVVQQVNEYTVELKSIEFNPKIIKVQIKRSSVTLPPNLTFRMRVGAYYNSEDFPNKVRYIYYNTIVEGTNDAGYIEKSITFGAGQTEFNLEIPFKKDEIENTELFEIGGNWNNLYTYKGISGKVLGYRTNPYRVIYRGDRNRPTNTIDPTPVNRRHLEYNLGDNYAEVVGVSGPKRTWYPFPRKEPFNYINFKIRSKHGRNSPGFHAYISFDYVYKQERLPSLDKNRKLIIHYKFLKRIYIPKRTLAGSPVSTAQIVNFVSAFNTDRIKENINNVYFDDGVPEKYKKMILTDCRVSIFKNKHLRYKTSGSGVLYKNVPAK